MNITYHTLYGMNRPILWIILLFGVSGTLLASQQETVRILQRKGALYVEKDSRFVPVRKSTAPGTNERIRIGEPTNRKGLSRGWKDLGEASLVISYSKHDLLTLSNGSTVVQRPSRKGSPPDFRVTGTIHFFVTKERRHSAYSFKINGIYLKASASHLFIHTRGGRTELTVVEGKVDVVSASQNAVSGRKNGIARKSSNGVSREIGLPISTQVIWETGDPQIGERLSLDKDPAYQASIVPGFQALGPYKKAGSVVFTRKPLQITRYKRVLQIDDSPALLMEGDEIKTAKNQTVLTRLDSGDNVRLYPNSTFSVLQFKNAPSKKYALFGFLGKIRARIAKRKRLGKIRFKTVTAVIGVKGTDFEASGSKISSEVATVEGEVGVSAPNGKGEVSVKAGMMTAVAAGALPELPKLIPPERLRQLHSDAISVSSTSVVKLKAISFITPQEGVRYNKPVIKVKATPKNATLLFALDRKNLTATNGHVLSHLSEGVHRLTVKGAGKGAISRTVTFFIDKTAPALKPEKNRIESTVKQGSPIKLLWSEPIKTLRASCLGKSLMVRHSENSTTSELVAESLFQTAPRRKAATISFQVTDQAGNQTAFKKTYTLKYRPQTPPTITIADGRSIMYTRSLKGVDVTSDREIDRWSARLDSRNIITKPSRRNEGKRGTLLAATFFSTLNEGVYTLTVEAEDDFHLTGRQQVTIHIDKTPPTILDPLLLKHAITAAGKSRTLTMKRLSLKEGETLLLKGDEPLSAIEFSLEKRPPLALHPTPDNRVFELRSLTLKKAMGSLKSARVRFIARDLAGNRSEIQGTLFYKKRPRTAPTITIKAGRKRSLLGRSMDIVILSNRELYQWSVNLNGKEVEFWPPKNTRGERGIRKIILKKETIETLADGKHKLIVSGKDDFLLPAHRELSFVLDRKKPLITKKPEFVQFENLKLGKRETIQLVFDERIARMKATLVGHSWPLKLSVDGRKLSIRGISKRLSYTPRPYRILLFDDVGNMLEIRGMVSLREPRWQALRKNFIHSIVRRTGEQMDNITLSCRPTFTLDSTRPEASVLDLPKTGTLSYKKTVEPDSGRTRGRKTGFMAHLDDPFINGF